MLSNCKIPVNKYSEGFFVCKNIYGGILIIMKYLTLTIAIVCFVFVLGSTTAHADSYAMGDIQTTGNIDSGSYQPGGKIIVTGVMTNGNPYVSYPVVLNATANGSTQTIISQQTVSAGSSTSYYSKQFTAPSSAGNYSVSFSTGVDITGPIKYARGYAGYTTVGPPSFGCIPSPGGCASEQKYKRTVNVFFGDIWNLGDPWPVPTYTLPYSVSFLVKWSDRYSPSNIITETLTIPAGESSAMSEGPVFMGDSFNYPTMAVSCVVSLDSRITITPSNKCN